MSLKRNVALNVAGSVVPLFIAIVTVPLYLKSVGATRYGILTLVWLFAGYFSLLDFGISRATVNLISKVGVSDRSRQTRILWSALWINLLIGLVGMCAAYPLAHYLFDLIKFDDPVIRDELVKAIPWLCLTVPLTLISAVWTGGLEARERFDLVNLLSIVGGLATQLLPVLVAYQIDVRLDYLILTIVLARVAMFVLLLFALARAFPLGKPMGWDRSAVSELVAFGSWASVSGIISPVLDALDRFVIGAKLSANDVAMYAIPFSVADKLRIIPRALARAAYPRLSSLPQDEAAVLYKELVSGSLRLMTPLVLMGIVASKHLLQLWIGADLHSVSGVVAIVLLCGAWFNSIAMIPFVYIQARGAPNVTATIHSIEFIPFVLILFALVNAFGVVGAAMAWSGRMMLDCFLLCGYARAGRNIILAQLATYALVIVIAAYVLAQVVLSWYELGVVLLILGVVLIGMNVKVISQVIGKKRRRAVA